MNPIVARGLSKQLGNRRVLHGLELSVDAGSIYGLLGRNGAGKTTLMRLAMGLLVPDGGEIAVLGRCLSTASARAKESIGDIAEQSLLPAWMTVRDAIHFEAMVRPAFDHRRVDEHVRRQGLDETRPLKLLSKGQKRRLDLELALAGNLEVLILDEPFDGLDPVSRMEAMEAVIERVARAGTTVLVSSHILTELERICGRIGVLSGGRIAFESDLDPLKESVRVVFGSRSARNVDLPVEVCVLGRRADDRGSTWIVRGLDAQKEERLQRGGFQLSHPGLEDLGVELMRCLNEGEQRP